MSEHKKASGGLFGLLARQYLLFTLTLLLIGAALFSLWDWYTARLYQATDWGALLADEALAEGRYDALRRYLAPGSDFAVYDEAGALVWAGGEGFDEALTSRELAFIPLWGEGSQIDAYELSAGAGEARYLLVAHTAGPAGREETSTAVLDEQYRVLLGDLADGSQAYTAREYQYLTGGRFPDGYLARWPFTGRDGQSRTLLAREMFMSESQYQQVWRQGSWIPLLFVPACLVAAGLFIRRLRQRIARPLAALGDAVEGQAAGRDVRVGDCGGPREIRRIGESFDRFAALLAQSEAERRRLDEGRQKLIADISHDIKTPVTVISGTVDALCDGKVPPEDTERSLRLIQRKAADLAQLTEAFHEYSKTEHPRFELVLRRVDLCEFLRAWLAQRYDEIDLAGFSLEPDIPETPLPCQLDELQLRRALDNLLSNALRHNRLGTLLFVSLSARGDEALLRVGDNGEGIPPRVRSTLFEPFVRGSDARTGAGSGLGLAITRRILEKHGGSIELAAEPAPGRSTEFLIRLPLESAAGG